MVKSFGYFISLFILTALKLSNGNCSITLFFKHFLDYNYDTFMLLLVICEYINNFRLFTLQCPTFYPSNSDVSLAEIFNIF